LKGMSYGRTVAIEDGWKEVIKYRLTKGKLPNNDTPQGVYWVELGYGYLTENRWEGHGPKLSRLYTDTKNLRPEGHETMHSSWIEGYLQRERPSGKQKKNGGGGGGEGGVYKRCLEKLTG